MNSQTKIFQIQIYDKQLKMHWMLSLLIATRYYKYYSDAHSKKTDNEQKGGWCL